MYRDLFYHGDVLVIHIKVMEPMENPKPHRSVLPYNTNDEFDALSGVFQVWSL